MRVSVHNDGNVDGYVDTRICLCFINITININTIVTKALGKLISLKKTTKYILTFFSYDKPFRSFGAQRVFGENSKSFGFNFFQNRLV